VVAGAVTRVPYELRDTGAVANALIGASTPLDGHCSRENKAVHKTG
jgi:hypothetical protein